MTMDLSIPNIITTRYLRRYHIQPSYEVRHLIVITRFIALKLHYPGPAVGGPFSVGENSQLAVTKEYFDRICATKLELDLDRVQMSVYSQNSAARMTNAWEHILRDTDNPCVESSKSSGPIYDHEQ